MRRKGRGKKRSGARIALFVLFALFVLGVSFVFELADRRLVPAVLEIGEFNAGARLNNAIDASMRAAAESTLTAADFYVKTEDVNGKINSLSVNTVLINEICSKMAVLIGSELSERKIDYISVPLGALLGVEWLANAGPSYKIGILPMGGAEVDYETSFTAAGINQINFQVWINVNARMRIVNPVQTRDFTITRKIALVNTVFSGEIPNMYISK